MVIIVQLLTTNHDAPGRNVRTGIWCFKITVTPIVSDAVNDAGCCHRNPHHLNRPNSEPCSPKQAQINNQHQTNTLPAETGVQIALNPVVRGSMTILGHGFLVFAFSAIQLSALPKNFLDAMCLRAVRVFKCFAFGVVFAVNRYPFFSNLTRA